MSLDIENPTLSPGSKFDYEVFLYQKAGGITSGFWILAFNKDEGWGAALTSGRVISFVEGKNIGCLSNGTISLLSDNVERVCWGGQDGIFKGVIPRN